MVKKEATKGASHIVHHCTPHGILWIGETYYVHVRENGFYQRLNG